MAKHRSPFLRVTILSLVLLFKIIQSAAEGDGDEQPPPNEINHNCAKSTDMKFDAGMLPSYYHQVINFTIQDCKEVDFFFSKPTDEPLQWRNIHFKNIDTLRLRLTQLPSSIESIVIDNVTLDEMSIKLIHFQSTFEIQSLTIKNSVLKNVAMDIFKHSKFHNVTFHTVTFQKLEKNTLTFKFDEESTMKIVKSEFESDIPTGAIATQNAAVVHMEDVIFSSKLMTHSINFNASEKITITNVTFTEMVQESLVLSAPNVELKQNLFKKIATHIINLHDSDNLVIANNTFQENVDKPINWDQREHKYLPTFFGNSFPCDSSYSSNTAQWMLNTIEQFSSETKTFCDVLELNSRTECKTLFDEIRNHKNCTFTNSARQKNNSSKIDNLKYMSIVIFAVNVAILKMFQQ